MNTYLLVKWLHILSSVVLVGTGFGTAFYLFFANRSGVVAAQAVVTRLVVRADWWFTTPAIVVQPVTGLWMAHLAGLPLSTPWIMWTFVLYGVAGLCWIPVVWLQLHMAAMAQAAHAAGQELPAVYGRYARWWERLGYPAFLAMLAIFYLMVAKPDL
jgi:uncharacterized membrane protein